MPVLRKDVKDMTPEEKKRFLDAVHKLKQKSSGKVGSIYDEFVAIHGALMDVFTDKSRHTLLKMGHRRTSFLTWHRHFLFRLEQELREVDDKVFLPYWDWTDADSTKAVFSPDFIGNPESGGVNAVEVKTGAFTADKWKTLDKKSLRRNVGSISDLVNEQKKIYPFLLSIWKQRGESAYINFASQLESFHDFVHVWVGGDMSSIGTAVNDPVFFLNHCNVDRIYAMWQDFTGSFDVFPISGQSYGNNKADQLYPWDGNKGFPESDRLRDYIRDQDPNYVITNGSMLNYRTWRYGYDQYIGNISKFGTELSAKLKPWGQGHIYDLDIPETANYRIYTTGKTNTFMELYGPALCADCFGQLKAKDDNSGEGGVNASISVTLQPGKYYAVIRPAVLGEGGDYKITCTQRTTTINLKFEKPFRAAISAMWEIDWYDFTITNAGRYIIETTGNTDTMMLLYGQNVPKDLLAKDDNSGTQKNARIQLDLQPGTYHVAVRSSNYSVGKYQIVLRQ